MVVGWLKEAFLKLQGGFVFWSFAGVLWRHPCIRWGDVALEGVLDAPNRSYGPFFEAMGSSAVTGTFDFCKSVF